MARNQHKVDKFSDIYIKEDFNQNKAMKEVSPYLEGSSLTSMAHKWIHSPQVLDSIASKIQKLNLTPQKIKYIISARLLDIMLSVNSKDNDSIQASGLLAKLEKLTSDISSPTQVNIYQEIIKDMDNKGRDIDN